METNLIPTHLPDETAYSFLCRLHLRAAHRNFIKDTLPLLGVNASRPANEFPSFIPRLSTLTGISKIVIVNEMTAFPYYKPFASNEATDTLLNSLITGHTASLQSRLGKIASRLPTGFPLVSCPLCVIHDRETYGTAYWHITHQLAGINVCPIHHCYLHMQQRSSKRVVLPLTSKPIELVSNTEAIGFSKLIQHEVNYCPSTIDLLTIHHCYRHQLAEVDLLTEHNCIKQRLLRHHLINKLKSIHMNTKIEAYFTSQINGHHYPECLFYNVYGMHQPLKHLLLISALFQNWSHFLECLETSKQSRISTNVNDEPPPNEDTINWAAAFSELKTGSSLRTVAQSFGTTISTLKIKAAQHNIKVGTRPSKLFYENEMLIVERLKQGDKTRSIASDFDLSVGAIEKVLSKHPELKNVRKKIWFTETKNVRRTELLDYLAKHPNARRNQIKRELNGAYMWLYRNERNWLYKTLPTEIPREQRYNRNR